MFKKTKEKKMKIKNKSNNLKDYSEDQKLVKAMCSKEFREFLNNFENIYNSMEKLGCFKNLKGDK
jgi:CRISPR/Cas system CMR subunit Cmr6 (Cas7 group RAMP superfamily)